MTTGAGSAKCGLSGDSGQVNPGTGCVEGCHHRDCGSVTRGTGSGEGHPGDCGCVTPGTCSGKFLFIVFYYYE